MLENQREIDSTQSQDSVDLMREMHAAAHRGDIDLMKSLHERGCSYSAEDENGCQAMHFAAEGGQAEMMRYLLQQGVPCSGNRSRTGWTPLHYAAGAGSVECMKIALDNGVSIKAQTWDGKELTPLQVAINKKQKEAIAFLKEKLGNPVTFVRDQSLVQIRFIPRATRKKTNNPTKTPNRSRLKRQGSVRDFSRFLGLSSASQNKLGSADKRNRTEPDKKDENPRELKSPRGAMK